MCDCLSFILLPWTKICKPALLRLLLTVRTRHLVHVPAIKVEVFEGFESSSRESSDLDSSLLQFRRSQLQSKSFLYSLRIEQSEIRNIDISASSHSDGIAEEELLFKAQACKLQKRYISNGGTDMASLFAKKGLKKINQDTMLVIERFASLDDTVLCGVFDGHGPDGHLVARNVRDTLPEKLASAWLSQQHTQRGFSCPSSDVDKDYQASESFTSGVELINDWKEAFQTAFKLTDRQLLMNYDLDCITSGTTAVVLLKQGNDLIVGNVGDSRAILGVRTEEGGLLAVQLTVDSKPNIPREAERIKRCDGRIFALQSEPSVYRVWLPDRNIPGLAMSRALGDYCIKNHGVIAVPEVTYRHLTNKDEFVLLATDGVWDVLSNEQVAEIVSSTPEKAFAARAVVESAVQVWRSKYTFLKADDCAAVCLFF